MSDVPNTAYEFEIAEKKAPRRPNDSDRNALQARLELTDDEAKAIRSKLDDFVTHHHSNIAWYTKAIENELCLRRVYFGVSMGLLLIIPLGIYGITTGNLAVTTVKADMTAAITAGLSGLFAFHRGATAWLDKRQLVALYAKTNAQLKTAIYTFERTWKKSRRGAATTAELGMALEDASSAALAIVAAEQDAHYEIEAAPTFGLADVVNSSAASAGQLTTALAAKESQESKDRREFERSIRELQARVSQLTEMITAAHAALGTLEGDEQAAKVAELNSLVDTRQSAELELAIAVSKLKSLGRA